MSCLSSPLRRGVGLLLALAAGGQPPAYAGDAPSVATNVTLASQYIFRGITQTAGKPALQGGAELGGSSGFYAGLWGSNVNWLQDFQGYRSGSLELDLYGGWRGRLNEQVGFDLGLIHYRYPGSRPAGVVASDTTELYAGATWRWLSAKLFYSTGRTFGFDTPSGSTYLDLGANLPIGDSPLKLVLHAGQQRLRGDARPHSYDDWRLALSYDASTHGAGWKATSVTVQVTGTDADRSLWTDRNGVDLSRTRWAVMIARSF